jgi:hypothetical protein
MSQFPNSPKLVKGALLEFGDAILGLLPNIILFQYNPEQLSHKLDQPPSRSSSTSNITTEVKETFRTPDLPVESISDLKIVLDATDQMEQGDPITAVRGIGPAIAALEMMMFPLGTSLLNLGSLLGAGSSGSAKVPPQQLPLVLFVWGPWRVIPVNVTSVSVVEQDFDPLLNPIRAEVTVSLRVISKDDLDKDSFAYGAYVWTQANREVNAALNIANTVQLAAGMLPF